MTTMQQRGMVNVDGRMRDNGDGGDAGDDDDNDAGAGAVALARAQCARAIG